MEKIIGLAGGGGGGKSKGKNSPSPSEANNTLVSSSTLNVLYAVCEGEIEGVSELYKSVYLDDVPIQSPSGEFNFRNVKLGFRPGTLTQNYIPSFASVESEEVVNTQIKKKIGPITRTITNSEINAVRLRFLIPQLQRIDSKTQRIDTTSVSFKVEVRTNNGPWVERLRETISGKSPSAVDKYYRIDFTGGSLWDIRVTRITDDSESSTLSNDVFWSSYTTIIDSKFRYPNTALLWIRLPGDQFKTLPRVSVRWKLKKVLVPNNYDPISRSYNGPWNGNFNFRWTDNPAWILFDILINNRYGCGERVSAESIDKWSFYAIAQYCDELIPSKIPGLGNVPRFTCNAYIRDAYQAYELLNQIASSFRGSIYWSNGFLFGLQDRPSPSVKLFTKANVIERVDEQGRIVEPAFKYSYTSRTARHTVALVSYLNKDNNYLPDVEYVEHDDGLSRYGYNPVEVQAFGCVTRDQAQRIGLWLLETEQVLTKTVTFAVGAYGAYVLPGEVVEVGDTLKTIKRYGGRIRNNSGGRMWLDAPIDDPQIGDTFKITTSVGGFSQHTVSGWGTDSTGFYLDVSGIPTPARDGVFLYSKASLQPQKFRVFNVVDRLMEQQSCYQITATEYNESIYNAVDFGTPIIVPPTSLMPPAVPNRPFNVKATISPIFRDGSWIFDTIVNWDEPLYNGTDDPYTKSYEVQQRVGTAGAWGSQKMSPDPSVQYQALPEDTYYFRVRAIDILDRASSWVESVAVILSRPRPLNPVGNIGKTTVSSGGVVLTWSDSQNYPYGINGYNIFIDNVLYQFVPLGMYYSNEIVKPPGVYNVVIKPVDKAGTVSELGLETILGDEFAPKNPSGELSISLGENGQTQLFWSDATIHGKDFKGYRVYRNGVLIEETVNRFTQAFTIALSESYTFRVKTLNTQGYESLGFIEFFFGADSGSSTVPNPAGQVTKVSASDGGVILTWTDTQTYKNFGGYRVYLDNVLVGETKITTLASIIKPPGTYQVSIKSINRAGLQSLGGLSVTLDRADYVPPAPEFMLVQQAMNGTKQFYWSLPNIIPRDLLNYRLRYNVGADTTWENSHFLKDLPISTDKHETTLFRQGIYTILLKLVDIQGNESDRATFTQVNLGDPVPDNVVELWDYRTPTESDTGQNDFNQRPTWQGSLVNLTVASNGDLVVVDPTKDAFYNSSFEVTSAGHLKASEIIEGNYALYYERITQGILWDNDTLPMWTPETDNEILWNAFDKFLPFPVAVVVTQEEYKVQIHIKPSSIPGRIKQFKTLVDAPDIVESFNDLVISPLGTRIKPAKPMNVLKSVNLTLQDYPTYTATRLKVIQKDPSLGALVEAYNDSGTRVAALVDSIMVGY
jgi:predicted phage tail protein